MLTILGTITNPISSVSSILYLTELSLEVYKQGERNITLSQNQTKMLLNDVHETGDSGTNQDSWGSLSLYHG